MKIAKPSIALLTISLAAGMVTSDAFAASNAAQIVPPVLTAPGWTPVVPNSWGPIPPPVIPHPVVIPMPPFGSISAPPVVTPPVLPPLVVPQFPAPAVPQPVPAAGACGAEICAL